VGNTLIRHFMEHIACLGRPEEVVIPIPPGRNRVKKRGYNQTGSVDRPPASIQNWSYHPKMPVRCQAMMTQVGLTATECGEKLPVAFCARDRSIRGRDIRRMENGITNGATLAEGAPALMKASPKAFDGMTLAPASIRHGLNNA